MAGFGDRSHENYLANRSEAMKKEPSEDCECDQCAARPATRAADGFHERCGAPYYDDTNRRRFLGLAAELPERFGLVTQ